MQDLQGHRPWREKVHSDQEKWDEINNNPRARDWQYEDLGSKG